MAFLEQRLDARIERGAQGGPVNRGRRKVYTYGGALKQQFGWSAPLQEWEVSHGIKSPADVESLRAMWYVVNFTPYEGFLFRDWSDYQATAANTSLSLVSGSIYQLNRVYTYASISFVRRITRPDASVRVFNAGGSELTVTLQDSTTGRVTLASGTPAYWTGTFNVPVTFADDQWLTEIETSPAGPMLICPSIKLEEVRIS